ncbi:DUF4132 domain-containing protein [Actinomadura xylanilytica]|uniref:DUF4132 domain-containing protein n=1 Tax=Actinomadura xylanilytica TaxID=887459 RepID=UPI00255AF785|nr:DUF4132 domain-containing protein [Actinomadura xylanilytica]MDL4776800.1 DUF4132 domain-containing protein [Actinomadura xylanilytica]
MADHRTAADEDVLLLPSSLRRQLHPRRGGHPGTRIQPLPAAPTWIPEKIAKELGKDPGLVDRLADLDWRDRVRRHLEGEPDPMGAAALRLLLEVAPSARRGKDLGNWRPVVWNIDVDGWVHAHGVAFAACALVETGTLDFEVEAAGRDWKLRLDRDGAIHWDLEVAQRMRILLAAASDEEFQDAVDRLAEHRTNPVRKVLVSYLVPTRLDWLEECGADDTWGIAWTLLCHTFSTPGRLAQEDVFNRENCSTGLFVTLADAAGEDALPLFLDALDRDRVYGKEKRLVEVIGLMPYDGAFQALLDRRSRPEVPTVLAKAMTRFPARALRLLAAGRSDLLAEHVRAHPEVTAALLPDIPDAERAAVEEVIAADPRVPDAAPDELPPLLVDPPWTRKRKKAKPVVITGLTPPEGRELAWLDGERDAWAASNPVRNQFWRIPADTDWGLKVKEYRTSGRNWDDLFPQGPEEVVRPLLADWKEPEYHYWSEADVPWVGSVLGRYGTDAIPLALSAARVAPAACGKLLGPCLSADVAALAAALLAKKAGRRPAVAWLGRHGVAAARYLFAPALGKAGKDRRNAEAALHVIASDTGIGPVVAEARAAGDEVGDAIEALLNADPLEKLPSKIPVPGEWAAVGALPQILLRGRERALPAEAAGHVVTMLAISKQGEVYAGVEAVREMCDPRSLEDFAWELFERWELHGSPVPDGWALAQLGWLGGDETVRRLTPLIRTWPTAGGIHKATVGLDALGTIGTEIALMHLHGISRKAPSKSLKRRAQDKIQEIADGLGLDAERLADRLVPDFGLDADGTMVLDYGPRSFTVGFDHTLTPFVLDGDGKRLKSLPKPSAKDDQELAPAAHQRFTAVKKEARSAATEQIRRLERAMATRRRWTAAEFQDHFVSHPLIWNVARRLVWLADGRGFRIAEDRSFANVNDDALTLAGSAEIGIAHPLDLGDEVKLWREVFEDYELSQPFPQIDRPTYALTDEEWQAGRLIRFEGTTVRSVWLFGLSWRGWLRESPRLLSRPLPGTGRALVELHPGLAPHDPEEVPEQRLAAIRLNGTGDLDPVAVSEIIGDLARMQ